MENKQITFEDVEFGIVITSEKKKKQPRNKRTTKKNKVDRVEIKEDTKSTETKEPEKTEKTEKVEEIEVISINSLQTMKTKVDITDKKVVTTGLSMLQSIAEVNKVRQQEKNSKTTPYIKREQIMTRAECKLYDLMRSLLGDRVIILAKVRLADVVDVEGGCRPYEKKFKDIAMKHLDYVIINNENKELICVVELDDYTHDNGLVSKSDIFKNEVLNDCDIPLFRTRKRIDTVTFGDLRPLERIVNNYFAPKCPICGRDMEERESYSRGYSSIFYGCKGFPDKCRHTIAIK